MCVFVCVCVCVCLSVCVCVCVLIMIWVMLTVSDTDLNLGRVGAPLTCCEIRLRDWPEGASHCPGGCLPSGLLALPFTRACQSANSLVCIRAELLEGQSWSTHFVNPKWHKLPEQLHVTVGLKGNAKQRGDEAKCGSAVYYDGEFWWVGTHFAVITTCCCVCRCLCSH